MPPPDKPAEYAGTSFLAELLKKLSTTIATSGENSAAANEVKRQISQVSRSAGGDPISGSGVTKSGDAGE